MNREGVAPVLRDLEGQGLVELETRRNMRMAQAYPGARITTDGAAYVEDIREKRNSRVDKARACRTELLLWLFDSGEHMPATVALLERTPAPAFYGDPFTEDEVHAAARYLKDEGLIHGTTAPWGSNGAPLRAELTHAGRRIVEDGGDLGGSTPQRNAHPGQPVYIQHNYQPSGPVAQGHHARATSGLDAEALAAIVEVLRAGVRDVEDDDDREDADQAIDDLIGELSAEHVDPKRVQRRVRSLRRVAERVGNTALTAATNEGTRRLLELLGGAV
jgi:hypothetical protein